ncbi:MAG: hypothetical protein V8Q83_00335 [Blautia sp.]
MDYENVVKYCARLAETGIGSALEQIEKVYKSNNLLNSSCDWMILDEEIMQESFPVLISSDKDKVLEVFDWDDYYRVAETL